MIPPFDIRMDVLGAILNAPKLCNHCESEPAFIRVDEKTVACATCWTGIATNFDFTSATSKDGNVHCDGITESRESIAASGRSESLHSPNAGPACNRGRVRDSVTAGETATNFRFDLPIVTPSSEIGSGA